jgi:hypothetical protein
VAGGVQKAPRHEVAGGLALAVLRALWGFDGGAGLEGGCNTDRMRRSEISVDGIAAAPARERDDRGRQLPSSQGRRVIRDQGTAVIPVLSQYKSIGCSPGKHPDTRTTATGSDDDSRDIVHDRCLCIAA